MEQEKRVIVVGSGNAGKTSLIQSFLTNEFPVPLFTPRYQPINVDCNYGNKIKLVLLDTEGSSEYSRITADTLANSNPDVVLICFPTFSEFHVDSILSKWDPDLAHYLPETPVILVGTKIDVNEVSKISSAQMAKIMKCTGAARYFECSSFTGKGIREIFEFIALNTLPPPKRDYGSFCTVL